MRNPAALPVPGSQPSRWPTCPSGRSPSRSGCTWTAPWHAFYIIGLLFPGNTNWKGVTGGPWSYHYTGIQDVQGVYKQV